MITVNVTATDYTVASSSVEYPVTVTADNTLFTVTSQVSTFTVTNVSPIITFSTEGAGFDFAIKHRGEWEPNGGYTRNDVVRYENSIYICEIQFTDILNSEVSPLLDTSNWELFYWNQWTKQYLTITNWLDVGTDISAGGNLTVDGNGSFGGTLAVTSTATIGGPLTVSNSITGDSLLINNDADITGEVTAGTLVVSTGTFTDLTVGNQFTINGLRYPIDKGTYGQVLYTGGTETNVAAWVNLGELTRWELNEDLRTRGFNIVSNGSSIPLIIGGGVTGDFHNSITFNPVGLLTAARIDIDGNTKFLDDVRIEGDLRVAGTTTLDDLRVNSLNGVGDIPQIIDVESGFRFSDGTIQTSALGIPLPIATTSTLGGIIVGDYLNINTATGLLSVNTTTLSSAVLNTATDTLLGGIKVGEYLSINPSTGVLTVNTATLGPALVDIVLPIASDTVLGGVRIPSVSEDTQVGLQINSENGDLTLRPASTTVLGGIVVGSGLAISEGGVLSTTGAAIGNVSLTQDMETNGYKIRLGNGYDTTNITLGFNGVEINTPNSTTTSIALKSPVVVAGYDIYNSKIQASAYYDFSGTGAAFFPANVQFSDDTIQRTAWRGYDQGLIEL